MEGGGRERENVSIYNSSLILGETGVDWIALYRSELDWIGPY